MKKILAVTLAIAMLFGMNVFASENALKVNPGRYDITLFGAVPNDGKDDTQAFISALSKGKAIYVPEGEFIVKGTVALFNQVMFGAGSDKTIITADIKDPFEPIVRLSRSATFEGITLRYKDGLVTGEETQGERTAITTTGRYFAQRGTRVSDIVVENIGTGLYSDEKMNIENLQSGLFSTTWENVVIRDFSFRGIDYSDQGHASTGDYWNNITLSSGKYRADSALYLIGGESEEIWEKVTIKDTIAETPVQISDREAFIAEEIILDNVYALHGPLISWNKSVGKIEMLLLDYSDVHFNENPLILIKNAQNRNSYDNYDRNGLQIGTLSLNSYNSAVATQIFKRAEDCYFPFYITVDKYEVTNSDYDWFDFPTSEERLLITKKGEIATEGPTGDRPEQCLCPYYSKYYDTDLQKLLVWNGKEWK